MFDNTDSIRLKSKFFRGFADPTRLAILETLRDGEMNVNEIVDRLEISQPNASAHLACLRDCGLVKSEGRGKFTYYMLYDDKIIELLRTAEVILAQVAHGIYTCTRYEEPQGRMLPRPQASRSRRRVAQNPRPIRSRK